MINSIVTKFAHDLAEDRRDFYGGQDCMETFGEILTGSCNENN